jgi:hypothetical protein
MYAKHDGPGLATLACNSLRSRGSGRCRFLTVPRRPRECLRNGLALTSLRRGARVVRGRPSEPGGAWSICQ